MTNNIIAMTYTKEEIKEELEGHLFDLFYAESEEEKQIETESIVQLFTLAKDGYGLKFFEELTAFKESYLKNLKKVRKITMAKENMNAKTKFTVEGLEDLRMFSTLEVCEVLGVSDKTLRTMIKNGEIKAYRIGRNIKLRKADIIDYLNRL